MDARRSRFGWVGLVALAILCLLTFDNSQHALTWLPYRFASILLIVSMISSVVCPLIEAVRSSKLWLLVSLTGLAVTLRFFWILAD